MKYKKIPASKRPLQLTLGVTALKQTPPGDNQNLKVVLLLVVVALFRNSSSFLFYEYYKHSLERGTRSYP